MGRVLGLDYGEKRVGVAISDEDQEHVFTRPIILNRGKRDLFRELGQLVEQEGVERIVVGLPLTLRGERGQQATSIQSVMCELEEALTIPVDFEDERLTSAYAARFPESSAGADSIAAAAILESYLERQRRPTA
ncbi:MAG: Holliday junction resolvase RuvX [Candidatus Kerfeldbacteria bacterium]|nr:Holliday junction resolvase RuvX [Candidatus Kerfeldbacteria bacterium]